MFRSRSYDTLFFIAILATLFSLAPGLAHLFEMPRKMALPRDAYFTVQQIYSGWNLFGFVLAVQLIALVRLAWRARRDHYVFRPALAALFFLIAAQILFWTFTFPANLATGNWTQKPPDWEDLRLSWEYSHAAGALCQLFGLLSLIGALFTRIRLGVR
jgi:uncharacterized membrane protein